MEARRENKARPEVAVKVPGDGTYRLIEQGKESIKVDKMEHLLHMIVPAITKYQISAIREAAEMNPYEYILHITFCDTGNLPVCQGSGNDGTRPVRIDERR